MILWQVMDDPSQTQAQLYEDDDLMFTSDRSDSTTSALALNALALIGWFSSQALWLGGCNARARARPASPLSYTGSCTISRSHV